MAPVVGLMLGFAALASLDEDKRRGAIAIAAIAFGIWGFHIVEAHLDLVACTCESRP